MSQQAKANKDRSRKVYTPPSLILYGALNELTHGGSGLEIEMGTGMTKGTGKGVSSIERP